MKIELIFNDVENGNSSNFDLESSTSISSWLVDHYFTKVYVELSTNSSKSLEAKNVIGLHDMLIVCQINEPTMNSADLFDLCRMKLNKTTDFHRLDVYNKYLKRCGLTDLVDLWHECQLESTNFRLTLTLDKIKSKLDRLFAETLLDKATICSIDDDSSPENRRTLRKLIDRDEKFCDETISKNYIKHTLCTYLSLLLDSRNEHALVHCLLTPSRPGIERRTIVELRRLTKLPKNESLTMFQIVLSFIRRKELIFSRTNSQNDLTSSDDQSFAVLDKYFVGIKEFFDFVEQIQTKIEENESSRIESSVTFRQLMNLFVKQLRKDNSFSRCDSIIKETIDELCLAFEQCLPSMSFSSPIRSASCGGTLAGRRFLRSVAFLCAKQTILLPILTSKNDHYDSPSTGLKKATSSRLLRSPLTPLLVVANVPSASQLDEKKKVEVPVESVFSWKPDEQIRRKKSHRCLDLSTIDETPGESNSGKNKIQRTLSRIDFDFSIEENSTGDDNSRAKSDKRTISAVQVEPSRKRMKKIHEKPLLKGQKSIKNFFSS